METTAKGMPAARREGESEKRSVGRSSLIQILRFGESLGPTTIGWYGSCGYRRRMQGARSAFELLGKIKRSFQRRFPPSRN